MIPIFHVFSLQITKILVKSIETIMFPWFFNQMFFPFFRKLPGPTWRSPAPPWVGAASSPTRPWAAPRTCPGAWPWAVGCCWTSWPQGFRRPWSSWIHWWRALAEFVVDGTRWCPPNVINLFINPIHYRYTTNKNHSYWSYKPTYDMLGI